MTSPATPVPLDETWVREAFASVTSPGRLEVVRRSPLTIVDAAHNPAGMAAAMEAITEAFTFTRLVGVLAVAADKDVPPMLDQLEPVVSDLIVTRNSSPRSMEVAKLADLSEAVFGPDRVHAAARLDQAIEEAVTLADEAEAAGGGSDGLMPGTVGVLIVGSVITAGDARALLLPAGQADELGEPPQGGPRREQDENPEIRSPKSPTRHETGSGYDMRRLCATVLIFEAIVIGLAIPVAVRVGHVSAGSAGPAGGALAGAAVVTAIAVSLRSTGLPGLRIALVTGSILQLVMIASGVVVPVDVRARGDLRRSVDRGDPSGPRCRARRAAIAARPGLPG